MFTCIYNFIKEIINPKQTRLSNWKYQSNWVSERRPVNGDSQKSKLHQTSSLKWIWEWPLSIGLHQQVYIEDRSHNFGAVEKTKPVAQIEKHRYRIINVVILDFYYFSFHFKRKNFPHAGKYFVKKIYSNMQKSYFNLFYLSNGTNRNIKI